MKKLVTSILGATLLAGSVFAAVNQGMSDMSHSKMNKDHVQKCEAFMQKYQVSQSSWTPPTNILTDLYQASEN